MALAVGHHAHANVFSFASALRATFLPMYNQALPPLSQRVPMTERPQQRLRLQAVLPSIFVHIPALLDTIWDGLLRAVPKKKTSHMKKRHRQMAGKALKDVTALNKCSACGRPKRAHVLCAYCVKSIKQWLGNGFKTKAQIANQKRREAERLNEKLISMGKEPFPLPAEAKIGSS